MDSLLYFIVKLNEKMWKSKRNIRKKQNFFIYLAYIDIYTMATVTPLNQKKHCFKNKKTLCQYNICFILTQFWCFVFENKLILVKNPKLKKEREKKKYKKVHKRNSIIYYFFSSQKGSIWAKLSKIFLNFFANCPRLTNTVKGCFVLFSEWI